MSDRPVRDLPAEWPATYQHAGAMAGDCRLRPATQRRRREPCGPFWNRQSAFLAVLAGWLVLLLAGVPTSLAGQPGASPEAKPAAASPDVWLVALLALGASLVGLAALAVVGGLLLRSQRQQLESEINALQSRLQRLEAAKPASGAAGGATPETTPRLETTPQAELKALQSDLRALREEVDYLKNKLSTLLVSPETPPHPLPALSAEVAAFQTRVADVPTTPAAPADPFENQRVSDIIARYRGRLRAGHVDALTRHFSLNPSGLFLELEERGERLVFPAQEFIYAGDFQQNYSFVYDCDRPGSGYVVVVTPARLNVHGQVVARGRLRIE